MRYSTWDMEHCGTMLGDNSGRSRALDLGLCKRFRGDQVEEIYALQSPMPNPIMNTHEVKFQHHIIVLFEVDKSIVAKTRPVTPISAKNHG